MMTVAQGRSLLALARNTIAIALQQPGVASMALPDSTFDQPGCSFVTLTLRGELRGCIGNLQEQPSRLEDIRHNALRAAFHDPRFEPLSQDEWPDISIEVSVLGPATPLDAGSEASAISQLRPGIDGVVLECDNRRATFLPQVWDQLPNPHDFLLHLKLKAGLPANFWSGQIKLSIYQVEKFSEEAPL